MTKIILFVLFITMPAYLSGQHIQINSFQARAILKDHAELIELRGIVRLDSAQIASITTAYYYKDSAYQDMTQAQIESDRIAQSWHEAYSLSDQELTKAKKEIRRQKRIKVITIIVSGAIVLMAL